MSNYTSKNTTILATHMQGNNKRMLLLHKCDNGRHEYVIGSYFTVETNLGDPYDINGPAFIDSYSWDWGHYFSDVVAATEYWKMDIGEEN